MKHRAIGPALIGAAWAVLVPFGCGVDSRPPALTAGDTATSSAAASSGSGGAGGGTGAGGSTESPCACAAAAFAKSGSACSACLKKASSPGRECEFASTDCLVDALCAPVVSCLAACEETPSATCVSDCLYPATTDDAHQKYLAFLACTCESCGSLCAPKEPVTCTPVSAPDAGPSDAAMDGEGGDAATEADADGG